MTANPDGVPPVLLHHFKHNQCLHEQVVLLRVAALHVPAVAADDRVSVEALEHGFFRVTMSFGFMEDPSVPSALADCARFGLKLDPGQHELLPRPRDAAADRLLAHVALAQGALRVHLPQRGARHGVLRPPAGARRGAGHADRSLGARDVPARHPYRDRPATWGARRRIARRTDAAIVAALAVVWGLSLLRCLVAWTTGEPALGEPALAGAVLVAVTALAVRLRSRAR